MRIANHFSRALLPLAILLVVAGCAREQVKSQRPSVMPEGRAAMMEAMKVRADYIKAHYMKQEFDIAMRDGLKLHTVVYTPKDASADRTYPILMQRTPYSCGPYGEQIC